MVDVLHLRFRGWAALCLLLLLVSACGQAGSTNNPPAAATATAASNPVSVAQHEAATATAIAKTSTAATATSASASKSTDWTTYHRDNLRAGYVPGTPDPRQLTRAWNTQVGGAVYAQPLVVGNRVLVAT